MQVSRTFSSAAVVSCVLREAALYLAWFNQSALPFLGPHFARLVAEATELLKTLQPATRTLQAHCVAVKQKLQVGALGTQAKLKKELETLVFGVKVLLSQHGCADAFWMGNLKHKTPAGAEVGSQLLDDADDERAKPRRKRKAAAQQNEHVAEEAEADEAIDLGDEETEEPQVDDELEVEEVEESDEAEY